MQILLVEDDRLLADGLLQALKQEGFTVNHVDKGKDALHVVLNFPPDIVILDLGLPDIDGLEVLRCLRRKKVTIPVLVLTARGSVQDKVSGLDCGADDYLAKPFDMIELFARLRVLERRMSTTTTSSLITIGSISLDLQSRKVSYNKQSITLSKTEYMLLKHLMQNAGRILTRDNIEAQLHSWGEEISSNALEVHIHNLRKKISAKFIKTVRGVGYTVDKA
ncbi:MAG: DNA-binding response regulator [Gammaproteobacteria bacterium]|nr:MAG: DNA-binding response regulator [Gammaproteobacteria bacterium]